MKTYLVTGAAGFIGSNFIKYLLHKKYANEDIKIIILDALTYAGNLGSIKDDVDDKRCFFVKGDIRDRQLVDKLFAENDIDYVVNFAAESHVDRSIEDPQLFLSVNILGTQNLMDAARKAWVTGKDEQGYPTWKAGKRYHQVSTDEVYGALGVTGYFTETTPLCPHSPYSASKASADFFVQAYRDTYHMPVSITRCSNNYGPYHFPEKLIPLIINNILEGRKLPVYGAGLNVRDWLYVEDHCKAIDLVVREGRAGEVYNVGGHNEMRNIDIVKLTIKTIHDMMEKDKGLRHVLRKQVRDANGDIDISWINDSLIEHVGQGSDERRLSEILRHYVRQGAPWTGHRIIMDKFSQQLENYLRLAHSSALLVSPGDKANLNILLEMLGTVDRDIFVAYYGLFGSPVTDVAQIALKYRVPQSAIHEIVERDLHHLSITPEWQMMMRQLKPIVQKRIGNTE